MSSGCRMVKGLTRTNPFLDKSGLFTAGPRPCAHKRNICICKDVSGKVGDSLPGIFGIGIRNSILEARPTCFRSFCNLRGFWKFGQVNLGRFVPHIAFLEKYFPFKSCSDRSMRLCKRMNNFIVFQRCKGNVVEKDSIYRRAAFKAFTIKTRVT